MAKPGSEESHDETIARLAGDAAHFLATASKAYPTLSLANIEAAVDSDRIALVAIGDERILLYRFDGEYHAITTRLVHKGYRRKYRKASSGDLSSLLPPL